MSDILNIIPDRGLQHKQVRITNVTHCFGLIMVFIIGVYSGFYGAGSGTLYTYLLVLLFGQTFLESAGTRKIPQLISAVMAALLFALNGLVAWRTAAVLFAGMFTGSYVSARFASYIGNK